MSNKKIWFMTGASRGMGVDFAKAALAAGHAVVASGPDSDRVEVRPGGLDGVAARRGRTVGHHHHYRQSGVLPHGAPHGAIDELRRAVYRGLRRAQSEAARVLEIPEWPAIRRPGEARASAHRLCEPRATRAALSPAPMPLPQRSRRSPI